MVEFDEDELRVIARLVANLYSSAVEADLDPGLLESIYLKVTDYVS